MLHVLQTCQNGSKMVLADCLRGLVLRLEVGIVNKFGVRVRIWFRVAIRVRVRVRV